MNRPRHWEVAGSLLTLTTRGDDGKPLSVGRWRKRNAIGECNRGERHAPEHGYQYLHDLSSGTRHVPAVSLSQRLQALVMLIRRKRERQEPGPNHPEGEGSGPDQPCRPCLLILQIEELVDGEAERDERGSGSDPRHHGAFVGQPRPIERHPGA